MQADFFPLKPGRVMSYKTRAPSGEGMLRVEVLRVTAEPGRVEAACERAMRWGAEPAETRRSRVIVDKDAVRLDGDIELKFPMIPGVAWDQAPRRYEISSIEARARTAAGMFAGCVEVTYTIAGGDAGFGKRLYAPNVGFVYESCADEIEPYEIELTRIA